MTDICVANLTSGSDKLWNKLFLGLKNITAMSMCRKSLLDENIKKTWFTFFYSRIYNQLETLFGVNLKLLPDNQKEQFNSMINCYLVLNNRLYSSLGCNDLEKLLDLSDILNLNKKLYAYVNHLIGTDKYID